MLRSSSVVPLLVVVLLWCVVQLASAQQFQQCTYTNPTTGKSYDLTPLAQQFTTTSAESPRDSNGNTYYVSPCQIVVGIPTCIGIQAVCCTCRPSLNLGDLSRDSAGPLASGAEGYAITYETTDRSSTINYICDASAGVGQLVMTVSPQAGTLPPYLWAFEWKTQYACPAGSGGGGGSGSGANAGGLAISVGWIIVICLVGVMLVYFVAGVVVQKFVFKKEGVEMVPNSGFWLVLPGLIKDGHVFVYRRVMRLFGGGYQQI